MDIGLVFNIRFLTIIADAPDIDKEWSTQQYIKNLKNIIQDTSQFNIPKIDEGNTERAVKEINSLLKEETELSRDISNRKTKLSKIKQLEYSSDCFNTYLGDQINRIEVINWFADTITDVNICPFCGSEHDSAYSEIKHLLDVKKEIKQYSVAVEKVPFILDKEIAEINEQIRDLENKLNFVRTQLQILEEDSDSSKFGKQNFSEINRFIGRLEQSLKNLMVIDEKSDLKEEIKSLETRVSEIKNYLNTYLEDKKLNDINLQISNKISNYVKMIGVEKPEDQVMLDIENLTIKIQSDGRDDYLWEIGSGANYMGYHIATLLALHEYFLSLNKSPVPQFLFIDQPSQVYFPEKWPEDTSTSIEPCSKEVSQVHKIFETLANSLIRTQDKLQIILVDHVEEVTWKGIDGINCVRRWRNGKALLPKDWLEE